MIKTKQLGSLSTAQIIGSYTHVLRHDISDGSPYWYVAIKADSAIDMLSVYKSDEIDHEIGQLDIYRKIPRGSSYWQVMDRIDTYKRLCKSRLELQDDLGILAEFYRESIND